MYGQQYEEQQPRRGDMYGRAFPSQQRPRSFISPRLIIGLVMAAIALFSYFGKSEYNPITGEKQHISITQEQEVGLGLQSAPQMAQQHGGLHPDEQAQAFVDRVGQQIVKSSAAAQSGYPFDFHLLADPQTVNAFALPGGQVFITAALFARLETEGQLAGVLGHEVGHVVARHGAEHIAKQELTQGLTGALVLSTYDPSNPASANTAEIARVVGSLINMKYGREDELESDKLGVQFIGDAGYDPRALIRVMEILDEASGGQRPPEFQSTHPSPENRIARIKEAIQQKFPDGVPTGATP
jgi:predicted Zn-dependent protease